MQMKLTLHLKKELIEQAKIRTDENNIL